MPIPSIDDAPGLWENDGSLRDIYILGTSLDDWKCFIDQASRYGPAYAFDGQPAPLPAVENIFAAREGGHLLALQIDGVRIHCHFFVSNKIELDIDPRDVQQDHQHVSEVNFIQDVSRRLGKPALLTPENVRDVPYLSFHPETDAWVVCG